MTTNKDFPNFSVLLCWLVFASLAIEGNADEPISNIRNLRKNLLDKYDRFARPVKNASGSVPVKVQITDVTLAELNEVEETMTLSGNILMIWKDEHLQWDPSQHGGLDRLTFDGDEIWHPDLFIFTAAPVTDTVPYNKTHMGASASGTVIWAPPANIRSRCSMSMLKSMEDRICNLIISSYSYYKHELDLQLAWTEMTQEDLLDNGNPIWEIKNVSASIDILQFDTLEYPIATFSIRIRRRYDFISDVVRGPRTVAILLTLLMFWLPSTSDKKLNLGCLVLLVLSGSIIYLSSTVMSPSLLSVTVIPLRVILFTATSALLIEVIILNLSRLSDIIRSSPTLIRILSGMVGRVIGVCSRLEYKEDGGTVKLPETEEEVLQPTISIEEEWSLLAMALDRMFFVIYSIIFIIIS